MIAASRTHRIDTTIDIGASADRIWRILCDFAGYARWNPFVRAIAGEPEIGASLVVSLAPPGARSMRFRPVIVALEPERELRWKGKLLIPGLFDGEHWFRLVAHGRARTTFEHGEQFSGLLVPRFRPALEDTTRRGFVAMNEALKREAEHAA